MKYKTRVVKFGSGWCIERFYLGTWIRAARFVWITRQEARNAEYFYSH